MKQARVSRGRIMVIEDEPNIGKFCQRVLSDEGFTVDNAVQGKTAQDMIRKRDYDMIIIDLRMPVMNGDEFYRYLAKAKPRLARRVIFTTGDIIGGQTRHFIQRSQCPFLPKPFTPGELRDIVRDTLRQVDK